MSSGRFVTKVLAYHRQVSSRTIKEWLCIRVPFVDSQLEYMLFPIEIDMA